MSSEVPGTELDIEEIEPPDKCQVQSGAPDNSRGKRIILYRRSTSTYSEDDSELITGRDISLLKNISPSDTNMVLAR